MKQQAPMVPLQLQRCLVSVWHKATGLRGTAAAAVAVLVLLVTCANTGSAPGAKASQQLPAAELLELV
jgi:hypothetical protein